MRFKIMNSIVLACLLVGAVACAPNFNLEQFIIDVFDPQPGESVLVMFDRPASIEVDNEAWFERRQMAKEWHQAFQDLSLERGFNVLPIFTYAATGEHNAPLPERGSLGDQVTPVDQVMAQSDIVLAMTEFSASGPLFEFIEKYPRLRAASMPMISASMQETALAADYNELARKGQILANKLNQAEAARVQFSTGQTLFIDLGDRSAHVDDGNLHTDKVGVRVVNLPAGEAYIAPYEGELDGQPSRTEGRIPILRGFDIFVLQVSGNRVTEVLGEGEAVDELRAWFDLDPPRRNIAELGLGCNDRAVVTGNVLEDEKALGMHLAFGRSDHFGGAVGVDDFLAPENVVHWDVVYPNGGEIEIASLVLEYKDGSSELILSKGEYTLFEPDTTLNPAQYYTIWLFLVAGCLLILAWDMELGKPSPGRSKPVWALVVLVFGPLGLGAYLLSSRSKLRLAGTSLPVWRLALAGTAARVVMMIVWIVFLYLFLINFEVDSSPAHILGIGCLLPILISLFAIAAPVTNHVLATGYWGAVWKSAQNEFVSIILIFVGMFPALYQLDSAWFPAGTQMTDPIFWVMIPLAGLAGALLYYPYEFIMVRRGSFRWAVWLATGVRELVDAQHLEGEPAPV